MLSPSQAGPSIIGSHACKALYQPGYLPAACGKAHSELHRNAQAQDRRRLGENPAPMPLLRYQLPDEIVTQ